MERDNKKSTLAANEQKAHSVSETRKNHHPSPLGRVFVLVFFCFIAGFLGAWVFVGTGVYQVATDESISEYTQRLVLEEGEIVAEVAERVSPSVVSIITESQGTGVLGSVPFGGSGTGIVLSKEGYIVTNKHVVPEDVSRVEVVLSDGTRYEDVEVIGRDPLNDLAFLRIEGGEDLTPATLADSDEVKIGQKVIAIGNALGQYQNSVTSGIISGVGRPVTAQDQGGVAQLEDLLQTDAAINPGNSGGPLVNMEGEVMGINTALVEDAQGIGFAIPINVAKGLIAGVLENGEVSRSFLGVQYTMLSPAIGRELGIAQEEGAYIQNGGIVEGSAADRAGLQEGDVIIGVDDKKVGGQGSLASLLAQYQPGNEIKLAVVRDDAELEIDVTLDKYSE